MKVVFCSNFFNYHQECISNAFYEDLEKEFVFVETEEMSQERKDMGFVEKNFAYIIKAYNNDFGIVEKKINDADVVIIGSAPENLVTRRIRQGKCVFRYHERPLKKGTELLKYIPRFFRWHLRNPKYKPVYMLCASAYTAGDYKKMCLFKGKTYKWGYFPETIRYDDFKNVLKSKDKKTILWCGRFLHWKHPEHAIELAKRLKSDDYDFQLKLIGQGEKKEDIKSLIEKNNLSKNIELVEPLPPDKIRKEMERAGIYLFTSDYQEGWGVVLNESMNSGCAVVASHAVGSVPFLLKDGQNGLVYESENIEMLYEKVKYLLDHTEEQERLGLAAYYTIVNEWNAEVAVGRLIEIFKRIVAGEKNPDIYKSGPVSKAFPIDDKYEKNKY